MSLEQMESPPEETKEDRHSDDEGYPDYDKYYDRYAR